MKRQGFSVFELLLATLLLTIGLVSLINAFSIGFSQAGDAKGLLIAKNLAEGKLEEIRNSSYANILAEPKAPITEFPDYQRQVAVTIVQSGLKQVQVDVFWQAKGSEISISLYSYVSDI